MRWWAWLRQRLGKQRPPTPPRRLNGLPPDPLPEVTEIRQRLTVPAAKAQLWEAALDARERSAARLDRLDAEAALRERRYETRRHARDS